MAEATGHTESRWPRRLAGLAMVAGALCLAATATIHLHLHSHGYGTIPTIGPLFLLQAIAGYGLAVVVALWHRWFVAGAGALFLLATAGGLVYSVEFGLFGFTDSFSAPYAGMSLVLEVAGAVVLAAATAALAGLERRSRRRTDTGGAAAPGASVTAG